jgi:hypothetical protein
MGFLDFIEGASGKQKLSSESLRVSNIHDRPLQLFFAPLLGATQ